MRSRLKSIAYRLGARLGQQARLISRRNRRLDASEVREARAILAAIQGTPVPGLDNDAPAPSVERRLPGEAAA
jgi:hypothetical protein